MADLRIPLDYKEKDLPRAAWNLSQPVITTLMQCLNVPMKFETLKPKDDVDVNYDFVMQSMPMVGQLLNDFKLRVFTFKSDLSNYYGWMDNNAKQNSSDWKGKQHHYISPNFAVGAIPNNSLFPMLKAFFAGDFPSSISSQRILNYYSSFLSVVPSFIAENFYYTDSEENEQAHYSHWFSPNYNNARKKYVKSGSLLDMIGVPCEYISTRVIPISDAAPKSNGFLDLSYNNLDCFNADYILCYLDCIRNYMVNSQYGGVPYIYQAPLFDYAHMTDTSTFDVTFVPKLKELELSSIDKFIMGLRSQKNGVDIFEYAVTTNNISVATWLSSLKFGGHFLAQYERDMLTTLMYSGESSEVLVNVDDDGNFSINQLRFANRYQLMQDRADVAGGRYKDRLRTIWGSDDKSGMDIPDLVGVNSYIVSPRGVISTADTYNEDTDSGSSTGQLNGVVNTDNHSKYKHSIYTSCDSILMFMVQLVPDVVYSNGLGKGLDVHLFDDEYTPQFDQLGFQDVPYYKYNILPTYKAGFGYVDYNAMSPNRVVGKNIAFIDMISNVGRAHGKFANNEYFETWVLKRTFSDDVDVLVGNGDDAVPVLANNPTSWVSPYANPLDYQYPFDVRGIDDPNFVFMFGLDIRAVRSKGKSYMPTLGQ